MRDKLTSKQKKFVDEYLLDLNATAAAERAGYSKHTANEQGSQLLRNTNVASELSKRSAEARAKTEFTKEQILSKIASIAFANQNEIIKAIIDGKDLHNFELESVKTISISKSGCTISFHDRLKALDLLGQRLGYFNLRNSDEVDKRKDAKEMALKRVKEYLMKRGSN